MPTLFDVSLFLARHAHSVHLYRLLDLFQQGLCLIFASLDLYKSYKANVANSNQTTLGYVIKIYI